MALTKLQAFQNHARSIKGTLSSADRQAKQGLVSVTIASDFNKLLVQIAEAFPELGEALPSPARLSGASALRVAAKAPLNYLDLELMADRVIALLDAIQEK